MARFNLDNPYEVVKFKKLVSELEQKGGYVEIKRKYPLRSNSQNNYLHVLLGFFAQEFGYSEEQVKMEIFKKKCNQDIFFRNRVNKHGEEVVYIRSTSELDALDMTLAITRFRNYSSGECGFYLPEANEKGYLNYAQQQIDNYREFL